ncbi:MAG: geranylgeranylglyceryl/heptaprenylglyceryl phosphate synthase [Thermofilum sp. ex4484_15]|nr:MAG: geranylgeranylglyceryl/heptaprenylglyceryl phosphate synthase [Thermofilum sp. ex4484_15]
MGKVEEYLREEIEREGCIHLTLIDPDKLNAESAARVAKAAERVGSKAIMVGGSLGVTEGMLDSLILNLKDACSLPVILFPGDVSNISRYADAIWFLSVLNSSSTYHLIGAQVKGGIIVRKYGLEAIPLAYLILGEGGIVSYVSQTRPLPFEKAELIKAYAIAAELLGFRFLYLEGGSGSKPIPANVVSEVRKCINIPIIVGGGIKEAQIAGSLASAGANVIVTGNLVEEVRDVEKALKVIINAIKGARSKGGPISR